MRPLRNFKTNQCRNLISRIAHCAAIGIASANSFTVRYLTPLSKAGYISLENPASIHSSVATVSPAGKGKEGGAIKLLPHFNSTIEV